MPPLNSVSFYKNDGNSSILPYLTENDRQILDIGCGSGSNGRLINSIYPSSRITGVTCSQAEYEEASKVLDCCIHTDLERNDLSFAHKFDALLLCHVLEHLVDPVSVINKLLPFLKPNGKVIILLPNIASWRSRWRLARGIFEYTKSGIMDETHLHFYTYYTVCRHFLDPLPQLDKLSLSVNGSIPLGFLRHHLLNQSTRNFLDNLGCSMFPNLFGGEIILYCSVNDQQDL
ncbi:class I SAM-dependent methyltransferase [Synechococcus sp. CS-1324]|uniref:class I SAM-dependent methyltransferase n=1 Tax=Synechococcus sp. CS-1324 TaxID=2847980 RepID=UPI000DB061F4|nr:class I SAM-dependent methyltransferase [Synechococcus sp. CS-1324]MCT0230732.1 class I SAM-dependent methyltransferase [Synechococcus sp. CS-1324]PZV05932.1 MAG: class I SAM-dependent methyltransferase [Cyanobium sp.]